VKNPDSFAVNTAMMRCLVKAIALHGLGLYIYAGEDLPLADEQDEFDILSVIELFATANTEAELKTLFAEEFKKAGSALNQKMVIKAKDDRKKDVAK